MKGQRYQQALRVYRETSRDAWALFEEHLAAVDLQILEAIRHRGATGDEVEVITGMKHQTVSAQITHMSQAGLLVDSGDRRPTRSGRGAIVWAIAARQSREPAELTQGSFL